mmetsp:Transcript_131275/g.318880  ORF Transcript_131275/g.318880 Transcript_131275/m.318880 type:complete len:229 (-) Transcript_131275:1087-1773(-)
MQLAGTRVGLVPEEVVPVPPHVEVALHVEAARAVAGDHVAPVLRLRARGVGGVQHRRAGPGVGQRLRAGSVRGHELLQRGAGLGREAHEHLGAEAGLHAAPHLLQEQVCTDRVGHVVARRRRPRAALRAGLADAGGAAGAPAAPACGRALPDEAVHLGDGKGGALLDAVVVVAAEDLEVALGAPDAVAASPDAPSPAARPQFPRAAVVVLPRQPVAQHAHWGPLVAGV